MAANVKGKKGAKPKKAKKKAAPKAPKASGPALDAKTSPTRAASVCPASVLEALDKRCTNIEKGMTSDRGTLGQIISDAVGRHNLHAPAFKQIRRMRKWPDTKIAEWKFNFDAYWASFKMDDLTADLDLGDREPESAPTKRSRKKPEPAEANLADAMGEAMEADKPEYGPDAEMSDEERAALH